MLKTDTTRDIGKWAEQLASDFLASNGLTLLERNYRAPVGEIDLIMKDHTTVVFIEVRYRKNDHFYNTIESIDKRKCDRIVKTGMHYYQSNSTGPDVRYRFDIVTISGDTGHPDIKWIKNAFNA